MKLGARKRVQSTGDPPPQNQRVFDGYPEGLGRSKESDTPWVGGQILRFQKDQYEKPDAVKAKPIIR